MIVFEEIVYHKVKKNTNLLSIGKIFVKNRINGRSWFDLKFQTLSADYGHQRARCQLRLNHYNLSASGVSMKKSDAS